MSLFTLLMSRRAIAPQDMIDDARKKAGLPAVGVAIVRLSAEPEIYVSGVRKASGRDPVKIDDTWHIGSDTKAFTAALVADLIDGGKAKYDAGVARLLGIRNPDSTHRDTTIADLLGMAGNLESNPAKGWHAYQRMEGTLSEKRQAAALDMLTQPAQGIKLGQMNYSNAGFVFLGHIAEILAKEPYESAIKNRILRPLGLHSAGFGPNSPGQPAPHIDGRLIEDEYPDNPPVMNPAGCLHLSLQDWSKWTREVMLSVRGESSKLAPSYGQRIRAATNGDYVDGWIIIRRGWSKGPILTHTGSNTMNFAAAWIAPREGIAYLAVTNDGGKNAFPTLNAIVSSLIQSAAAGRR